MLVRPGIRALLLALLALALGAAPALAAPKVDGEFDVPGLGSNNKLTQDREGNIWVTTGNGSDVARITPSGEVKEFTIEAITPSGIALGPEGRLWVTRNGGVVSFDPKDPEGTKDPQDIGLIGVNHSIVLGPDGNLWVATDDKLVKVPPTNPGGATEVAVPGLSPKDIDVAGSLLVVADFLSARVVTVTTGGQVDEFKVSGGVQGVAGNPNGQYAFSQPTADPREFGLLAPGAAPIVKQIGTRDPFGIALGSDGAYWAPEFNSDGLMRVTPTGQITDLLGFADNSAPRQITAGPNNTLWVTLELTKKVGRVTGLEPPVGPPPPPPPPPRKAPETKIGKGPKGEVPTTGKRAKVKFTFSSADAGTTFECRMVKVRKKAKSPKFKACKSPKTFRLKPGKYRFEVRAVLKGVPDATPAKRSFKVVRVFPTD